MDLSKIFKKEKNIIIGAIHFPPLLGYEEFPGFEVALENALSDLKAFEDGGVDAVIVENNYDYPHKINLDPSGVAAVTYLTSKIKEVSNVPVGISVLWNDYKTALSIAKTLDLKFIRIPAFVDKVETSYGIVEPVADEASSFRELIKAGDVALFTDIHVKHAKLLSEYSLEESARLAMEKGSDGLIVTGKWTGDAPNTDELRDLKDKVRDFPVLIGSGVNSENIQELFQFADAAIVSTSLKEGEDKEKEVNVKGYHQRISKNKVQELISSLD